jgi:hypothetical protein
VGVFVLSGSGKAATVDFQFNAALQTGALAGTDFSGTASYDNQGETGSGIEYFSLTSLNFTLLGVSFTKADIDQGGQAILQTALCSTLRRHFSPRRQPMLLLATSHSALVDPASFGYFTVPDSSGSGTYTLTAVPEPAAFGVCLLGLLALATHKLARARYC